MMSDMIISNDSFSVLRQLYNGDTLDEPYPDSQLRQLRDSGLAVYRIVDHKDWRAIDPTLYVSPIYEIEITEAGKAYVEWREREIEMSERRLRSLEKMSESLKKDVESAESQILSLNEMSTTLKAQLESAEKDARRAAIRSWIAIAVSIVAIAVQLLT